MVRTWKTIPSSDNAGLLAGIDPSFRRVGLSFWDGQCLFLDRIDRSERTEEEEMNKSFASLFVEAVSVTRFIVNHAFIQRANICVVEQPPPVGSFAGGMGILISILLSALIPYKVVYLTPPAVGRNLFSNGHWKKSDSVDVAKKLKAVSRHSRVSGDEGDALVMLVPFLPNDVREFLGVKKLVPYTRVEVMK